MKRNLFYFLLVGILISVIYSCSDDNSPGTSNNNNNGGGNNTNGCAGGPTTVTDIDGNVYNVVSIGNQCWMKENLKVTHYKNGTAIPSNLTDAQWRATTNGACADYNNDPANSAIYGKLYNWYAVADPQGLCPTGWHVPTNTEWNILSKTIDPSTDTTDCYACSQSSTVGGSLKEIGTTHWDSPNVGATNSSNFTALPGGCRFSSNAGFQYIGEYGYWWTSTELNSLGYYRVILNVSSDIIYDKCYEVQGYSVRCVRD